MESIAAEFGLQVQRVTRVATGLINKTYDIEAVEGRFILQALNPIFAPEVNEDIEAVTAHLAAQGVLTPRMRRTRDGALWHVHEGNVWRVMTFVEGRSFDRVDDPAMAQAAGALLGRFHAALADLNRTFSAQRLGVHDTPRHLAALRQAVTDHPSHRLYDEVAADAQRILALADALPAIVELPPRTVHGDPKINNMLFGPAGAALCLIDLDTVGPMVVALELGDAFRSWCNTSTAGEDDVAATFSLALFEAAVRGYASTGRLSLAEQQSLVTATQTIIVELAARFAADALAESYFGWDATRFSSRGEHNLLRARGQLALARSLSGQTAQAEAIVTRAFEDAMHAQP